MSLISLSDDILRSSKRGRELSKERSPKRRRFSSPKSRLPEIARHVKVGHDPRPEKVISKKRVPLSLEELLALRKSKEDAESKPTFRSKKERATEALRAKQEEEEQQRKRMEEQRKKHEDYLKMSKESYKMDSCERVRRDLDKEIKIVVTDMSEIDREFEAARERHLLESEQNKAPRSSSGRKFLFDWKDSVSYT